jgi:hypothetical protein
MPNRKFNVNITKNGNSYPDQVIIDINKFDIMKLELKKYIEKYPNDGDLGRVLRKLVNHD